MKFLYDLFNQKYYIKILCSFRLVLEGKAGTEIPESSRLEILEKFLANTFALSDAEDSTSGPLNRGGIPGLPSLRTLLAIRQISPRAKFLGSDGLFCFTSICKFSSFKNPFATITSLSQLYFRLYKRKKWFLWTMAAAKAAKKDGDEWDLTWYLRWRIYTSIPTEPKDILPRNISQMITKTIPIRTRIVISDAMKRNIPLWVWW